MKLIPKRDRTNSVVGNQVGVFDFLTLYDNDGNLIARSGAMNAEDEISLNYEWVVYVAKPDGEILLTWDSLNKKFSS